MVLGAALGYLVAEDLLLNTARTELRTYADDLVVHADVLGAESAGVLISLEKSPHAPCSESDIGYMQGLIFQTHFLKDIGRLANNAFVCTARVNRIPEPVPITATPSAVTSRGFKIYRNDRNILGGALTTAILYKDSGVIVDDSTFFNPPAYPMRYSTFSADTRTGAEALLYGNSLALPLSEIVAEREGKREGNLYSVECSARYPLCQMAWVAIDDVLIQHRNVLVAFAILGSLFGVAIAFVSLLFMRRQSTLDKQLHRAVRRGELTLVYQPIVELPSGRIAGAEALVRWKTLAGEQIPPDLFIPVAERGGFIGEITRLVIHRVASEMAELLRQHPHLHIAVNFSATDLSDVDVLQELEGCGLKPSSISIELTERITSNRDVAQATISELRQHGHQVFIDDFGTGYSSLSYLHDLNVDGIKVDRSFTATIGTEAVTAVIVPQILKMAELLNLAIVIEGVETEAQFAYFSNTGRPMHAQGWYFSRPVPAEELIRKVHTAQVLAPPHPHAAESR